VNKLKKNEIYAMNGKDDEIEVIFVILKIESGEREYLINQLYYSEKAYYRKTFKPVWAFFRSRIIDKCFELKTEEISLQIKKNVFYSLLEAE